MPKRNRHREAARRAVGSAAVPNGPDGPHGPDEHDEPAVVVDATGPRRVTGPVQADTLASHLLDPARAVPVAVVSIPRGQHEPWIDADSLAADTAGLVEVYVLPTDESSWHLSNALPPMTQVYGGAGRVYPVGLAWTSDPYAAPLRFAYGPEEGGRATDQLLRDALGMAHRAGVGRETVVAREATGTVVTVVPPSRALVRLESGDLATVWQELTLASVPIERLVAPGMALSGVLDPATHRLDVSRAVRTAGDLPYEHGDVVLARVTAVRPDVAHLALLPDVVVPVPRHRVTGNPHDSLTSLLSVDEVVVGRFGCSGESLTVRLDDVDEEEEPVAAPALLPGGPPWLVPPVLEPLVDDPLVDEPEESSPDIPEPPPRRDSVAEPRATATRTLSLSLDAARAEIQRLERELAEARLRLDPLEDELQALRREDDTRKALVQQLREQVARQKTHLRMRSARASAPRRTETAAAEEAVHAFTDPVTQLEFEIYVAWARRIPAADKSARPLGAYTVGPAFLPSLDVLEGVSRTKVVDVVVEVLTGLAEASAGRDMHQLRTGPGGSDPPVRRDEDGATCWRVALQRGTPQARRLHFWRHDHGIELSRVVLHDDMTP